MKRRDFLKSTGAGLALLLQPACARLTAKEPSHDSILSKARERIEKYRQGPGTIRVRDAQGRPIPGARVQVEQLSHRFLFGCNFFMFARCATPELEDQYRTRFANVFNYATLGFYWAAYERDRGHPHYAYTDQVLEWTSTHGIRCKGHPLVWDHPAGSPRWLPDDNRQIQRLSNARVQEIVSRFRDRIGFWDVVNEATHLPDHHNQTKMAELGSKIGPVQYTAEPLKIARAANPAATLLVNDYRTDKKYLLLLKALKENGKFLFDTVGIQSHMHDGAWPLQKVLSICDTFSSLGLPIHFTETTIVSGPRTGPGENWGQTTPEGEARQAEATAQFYTCLFSYPTVQAITWWDFSDAGAWQRAPAGWVRHDMSPKPVYERMQALIKRDWWTRVQAQTDHQGKCKVRAFYGRHRVSAETPNGHKLECQVEWEPSKKNEVLLTAV